MYLARCRRAETTRDCPFTHNWRDGQAFVRPSHTTTDLIYPAVTLCINGCRLSADPTICVHANPTQPRREARPRRSVQDLLNANFPPGTEPYIGEEN